MSLHQQLKLNPIVFKITWNPKDRFLAKVKSWVTAKLLKHKILTEHYDEIVTETVSEINEEDVAKLIYSLVENHIRYNRKPRLIVLGRQQQAQLISTIHQSSWCFTYRDETFLGLPVIFDNTVDGVLVLCDLPTSITEVTTRKAFYRVVGGNHEFQTVKI